MNIKQNKSSSIYFFFMLLLLVFSLSPHKAQAYDKITKEYNVQYYGVINRGTDGVNTRPYGTEGATLLYKSSTILGKTVKVTKEAVTSRATWAQISSGSEVLGWIDKAGIDIETILSSKNVNYTAIVNRGTDGINTKPFGVEGYETIARSSDILGKEVKVSKEATTIRAVWSYIEVGSVKGWIDKEGLTQKPKATTFGLKLTPDITNNAIDLKWNVLADKSEPFTFKVYQKKPGSNNFQSISTSNLKEKISVLNIYPEVESKITYTTWNGTKRTLPKSASLEKWMEEPNAKNAKGYGMGLIDVEPVELEAFKKNPDKYLKNSNGTWKYDVVYFGGWDNNGFYKRDNDEFIAKGDINATSVQSMRNYIDSGRGVLFGHDTIVGWGAHENFASLRNYVNMKTNSEDKASVAKIGSNEVMLTAKGLFTEYPWKIGNIGSLLSIPYSHSNNHVALGDVWLKYSNFTDPEYNPKPDWVGPDKGDAQGKGTNNFYLTTWNNAAYIQTGHSNGEATNDEQMILANTLFYLAQLTNGTEVKDRSGNDIQSPTFNNTNHTLSGTGDVTLKFPSATDAGSTYEYYVEGTGENSGSIYQSEKVKGTITTGIQGYSYVIDNNATTKPNGVVNLINPEVVYNPKTSGEYFHVVAVDKAGNKSNPLHIKLDTTPPSIAISKNPEGWTNGNVTLTATASDPGGSGIKFVTLPNGTTVNGNAANQVISTNGTYTFKATDNAGNVTSKSIEVANIDKTAPTGTIAGNPTAWTNGNATLSINASDSGSGIKSIKKPDGTTVNGSSTSYVATANGTYSFVITDNAGNATTVSVSITKIDKSLPTLSVTQTPTAWTNGNVTLNVSASDTGGSGVKSITLPNGSVVAGSTGSQVVTANGTYTFKVTDNAGNLTSKTITVTNIDKTAPTGVITGNPTAWTNGNTLLTINASDVGSGVKSIKKPDGISVNGASTTFTATANGTYSFVITDNAGNATTVSVSVTKIDKSLPTLSVTQTPTAWTNGSVTLNATGSDTGDSGVKSITLPNGTVTNGATGSQDVTDNGTYTFKVTDNAGNVTSKSIGVTNIDKTVPTGTITGNPTAWTNSNITLSLTTGDIGSGVKSIKKPDGTIVYASSTVYIATVNGTYSFIITDNAGNTTTISVSVTKIDKSLPTLAVTQTPTAWTNGNVTLNATGSDTGGSGVKSITLPNGTVTNGATGSQTITANGTYTFKVTDNAGNVESKSITVTNIDKTAPTIGRAEIKNATQDNFDVYVYDVKDGESGINRIQFPTWTDTGGQDDLLSSWQTNPKASGSNLGNGTWKFTVQRSEHNYEFGYYTIHIYAYDNAGNKITTTAHYELRDIVKPTIEVTGNPVSWIGESIVLTVKASDAHTGVKSITLPDGTVVVKNGAKGETVTHTYTITKNGNYTFTVTDMYDNTISQTITVSKIDTTVPDGTVSANTTNWTNQDVILTITATDNASGVKTITLPDGTILNSAKATFKVTKNGSYSFVITDMVGNKKTITIPVGNIDKVVPTEGTASIVTS